MTCTSVSIASAPTARARSNASIVFLFADTAALLETVYVNGLPAPIYYVSPAQVSFRVPADVSPGACTAPSHPFGVFAGNLETDPAVEAAIKLAKKETLADAKPFMNDNIKKEVPAILLEVTVVDKSNLMDTVIKDGYVSYDDVYAKVPQEQRPPKPQN